MSMKSYVVVERFTLSLINNPALNMGLTVSPGEILQYDGYNVKYGSVQDASTSLSKCIKLGWLRLLADDGAVEQEVPQQALVMQERAPLVEERQEIVREVRHEAKSDNNARTIYSSATSSQRGLNVDNDEEGVIARTTSYQDAGSVQQRATTAQTGRTKLAVLDEEGQNEVVATVRTDRGVVAPSTVREKLQVADYADEGFIPLKRRVPSKAEKTEVTSRTPISEEAIERTVLKQAGIQYKEYKESPHSTVTVVGSQGIVDGNVHQQAKTSEAARREWEASKLAAIEKRRAAQEKAPVPAPPEAQPVPTEVTVNGYTYEEMKSAGWTDSQLLASEYAKLVPVADKGKKAPPPPPAPKKAAPKAKTSKKASAKAAPKKAEPSEVEGEYPENWETLNLEQKVALVESLESKDQLNFIRVSKKSHWKVKKGAIARLEALA